MGRSYCMKVDRDDGLEEPPLVENAICMDS